MPGRRLSAEEKRLLDFWDDPPAEFIRPLLRSIEISGGTGIRGIDSLIVPFRYPLTAICGRNGTGKTTVLALAALAHHSPPGWFVYWANSRPRPPKVGAERTWYIFSDFFLYGPDEEKPDDVSITWRFFKNGAEDSTTFNKSGAGWGRYESRSEREIDFLPLARILPANDITSVRNAFTKRETAFTREPLDEEHCRYLGYIMARTYKNAEVQFGARQSFRSCETSVSFTAFNMGGGESCLIELLRLLQRIPDGGMLVVEEIESCLHPEAQVRLAEILIKICQNKKIQIVCSTHSETFLDAIPRQARLLLRRTDDGHEVLESPSTRFAVYEMTGEVQPELVICCEDVVGAVLIEEALPHESRRRLRILEIGSNAIVIRQGVAHLRGQFPGTPLCVLDGDCTEAQIRRWIRSECGDREGLTPEFMVLPGDGNPPETWLIQQLEHDVYLTEFADQLACSKADASAHVAAMQADLDHHDIVFTLHNRTGLDELECVRRIVRSVARRHPQLDQLREKVEDLLD